MRRTSFRARGLVVSLLVLASACAAATPIGAPVTPERTLLVTIAVTLAVPMPDGSLLADDGTALALIGDTLPEPVVLGASGEIGTLVRFASYDGATLIVGSGGLFVVRDGRVFRMPIEMTLASGELVVDLASAGSDLWIATNRGLYLYSGTTLTPVTVPEVSVAGARLADAGGGAVWVATDANVLRLAHGAGTALEATVLGQAGAQSIAVDADGTLWLVADHVLHAYAGGGLERADLPIVPARVLADRSARDVWIAAADGTLFHQIDGVFRPVVGATPGTLAVADGVLYASGDRGIVRMRARHPIGVEGLVEGQDLHESTDVTIDLAARTHVTRTVVTVDGAMVPVSAASVVTLEPAMLSSGAHRLDIHVEYDDGTLPASRSIAFTSAAIVTWTGDIEPLYAAQCGRCHGPAGPSPTRLDTRAQWMTLSTTILENVRSGRMPLGGPALSAGDVSRIQLWVDHGFPE